MKNLVIVCTVMFLGCFAFAQKIAPKLEMMEDGLTKVTFFHEDGSIAQIGTFLNNKRHGEWTSYDTQGNKIAEAEYTNDQKSGKWFFWKGDQLTEVDYDNNAIVSVSKWVSKGSVVSNRP
ncbi:MAG: nicotinic acid mononucleotide adenyltransferase [Nonlabens sp.]